MSKSDLPEVKRLLVEPGILKGFDVVKNGLTTRPRLPLSSDEFYSVFFANKFSVLNLKLGLFSEVAALKVYSFLGLSLLTL